MSESELRIAGFEKLSDEELAKMYDGVVCNPRYGEGGNTGLRCGPIHS